MNSIGIAQDWGVNWAWGVPLILLIVVFHAYCLGLLNREVSSKLRDTRRAPAFFVRLDFRYWWGSAFCHHFARY